MLARALPFFLLAPAVTAQLVDPEFTELRIRPFANDHQAIEVIGVHPFQTAGHHLAYGASTIALPPVSVAPNDVLVIHFGVAGVNTSNDVFLPSAPPLGIADAIAWFRTAPSANAADLIDYVCWGGVVGPHAATAVLANRWTPALLTAVLPPAVGSTLANRRFTRTASNQVGRDAWYGDSTPTLGSENDPGMTWNQATGCVTPNAPLFGHVPNTEVGPWLGEPTSIAIWPVPSLALLVLSTTLTAPIPLDGIGMPSCFANITIEATALVPGAFPYALFPYTVPSNPLLTGAEFYMQAFVPDPTAGNAIGAQVTNTAKALIGSR